MKSPERSCNHKAQLTKQEARDLAYTLKRESLRRGNKRNLTMNAYKCRYCGSWHVGHAGRGRTFRNKHRYDRRIYFDE